MLRRLTRSIALPRLQQGTTLSFRSTLPITQLRIESGWRDDGHVDLEQIQPSPQAQLIVRQDETTKTSLGREMAHVSIVLQADDVTDASEDLPPSSSSLPHTKPKPVDKVILDDGSIVPDSEDLKKEPRVEYYDGMAHLKDSSTEHENAATYVTVQVPEQVNLECNLEGGGSIVIPNKIEGDVTLLTTSGDVRVSKLRGHKLQLEADSVHVSSLLEAESLQVKGRLRAKQIHGRNVVIECTGSESAPPLVKGDEDDEGSLIDVGSLYIAGGGATLTTSGHARRRAIRVKSNHGAVQVNAAGCAVPTEICPYTEERYPLVELGGVNGSCEVSVAKTEEASDWTSCKVHLDSLSPDSISLVSVDVGNVEVTVDRKVESDLRLASLATKESLLETGALLAEEEDDSLVSSVLAKLSSSMDVASSPSRISIETEAFTGGLHGVSNNAVEYMDGWIDNKSHEPDSRFDRKVRGETGSVGKIRIDGAAAQALHGFNDDRGEEADTIRPLFAVASTGSIRVETVSWLGAIARRYGLQEEGRDLGRTASRRGRPLSFRDPQ